MGKDHIVDDEELVSTTDVKGMNLPLTILVALVLFGIGVGIAVFFVKTKKKPVKDEEINIGTLVETQPAERKLHALKIEAQGSIVASKTIVIFPEATGRITKLHARLVPGGLIKKKEKLFNINTRDTRISIAEQRTMLEQAKARLDIERGQQAVAKREWELFNKSKPAITSDNALALRKPQLKNAKVAVDAAQARLSRAKLSLARTSYRAPFDAMVLNESVEIGQLVSPNTRMATLVGTDTFWVQVSLPVENLPFIRMPDKNGANGAKVNIEQSLGSKKAYRKGTVIRLLPNLDPAGRMARLIIEIEDPLNLKSTESSSIPLLLNTFVNVKIEGKQEENLVRIPRKWLHDGKNIYVYNNGALEIKGVDIAWRREEDVLISAGLNNDEQIIISRVIAPIAGMKLRLATQEKPKKTTDKIITRKNKKEDGAEQ